MSEPTPRLRVVRPGDETAPAVDGPPRLRTAWTADELMAQTFPPPRWAVPGLIPEGVNLLAGPPKVGKSWLSLGAGADGGGRRRRARRYPHPGRAGAVPRA